MAELADALDLGSSGAIHGGSSPFTCTTLIITNRNVSFLLRKNKKDDYLLSSFKLLSAFLLSFFLDKYIPLPSVTSDPINTNK